MKNMLVLSNFTEASETAAKYAYVLSRKLNISQVTLCHSYESILVAVSYASAFVEEDPVIQNKESLEQLGKLNERINDLLPPNVAVNYCAVNGRLPDAVAEVMNDKQIDIVVMGAPRSKGILHTLFGDGSEVAAKESHCPVLIVPKNAEVAPVENIVFACNLKQMADTAPMRQLKLLLSQLNVPLSVVYITRNSNEVPIEASGNSSSIHSILADFNPQYHHINNKSVVRGITEFATQLPHPLIVIISKRHGPVYRFLHRSITNNLLLNSAVPVMVFHDHDR